jgi:HPt (histidine-containing phosphotransfer) domain-containing protein
MSILYKINQELKEIVPPFIKTREDDIELLNNFFAEKNFEELKSIGHKIKGTSGSYEFMELSSLGEKIEQAASTKDIKALEELILEYEKHVKQIEVKYV